MDGQSHSFEFRGQGFEYFKIWIVNILLTIITLGIYSAWATVRNKRYFYSNLYLDGSNFRYLAEPLTILKGRIIAIVVFIVYSLILQTLPIIGLILTVLLLLAIPYFVNQSLVFNHRMSAYRNIQFRFHGGYGEAFMVLFVWPIIGILTIGILYPLALKKLHEYMVRNSAYGTTRFEFEATHWAYARIFLILLGAGIVCALLITALAALLPVAAVLTPLLMILLYFGAIVFFIVEINKLYYGSAMLAEHGFATSLDFMEMAQVILINLVLTVLTLGLYLPAAKVRMTKYLAQNITLQAAGSLDNFAAAEQENVSALGEEMGQVFDFGL